MVVASISASIIQAADDSVSTGSTPDAVAGDYSLSQVDVNSLFGFISGLSVELYVIVALLLIIAGLLFALIMTKGWRV